jgi:alpha-maltose-1-phosphate synthase
VRVGLLTREWPPDVYGGAGVHVEFLARELSRLDGVDVQVEAFAAHGSWDRLAAANASLQVLGTDMSIVAAVDGCDVVHSHTWYANMAGHLAKLLYDVPHVLTAHSLEPLRPWKAEQLGGGYAVSSWAERTAIESADAVIAVSDGMRRDVLAAYPAVDPARLHVVHNGIDAEQFAPRPDAAVVGTLGVDPGRPFALFVGRITRQKGVSHLLAAAHDFDPDVQLVLCAGAPDTAEIAAEVSAGIAELAGSRAGVFWVREMMGIGKIREILSAATAFVCPSVYEPLGIVNLEAMACGTAVVASDVGGIPEVVDDGVTGSLVHYDADDAAGYQMRIARAVNAVVADPERAERYGRAGRQRCIAEFSWAQIAQQTLEIYQKVCA